jgi:hypothetical protein
MNENNWRANPRRVTVRSAATREDFSLWRRWSSFARWDRVTDRIGVQLAVVRADPESQVDVALAAWALMLGLFSLGTLIAVGYLNYTRLPWFDAWTHWIRYLNSDGFLTFLFSLHNEHRIPVTRLLYLADEKWFSADTRFLLWCAFLAQFGSALMLYRLACASPDLSWSQRGYILGLVLALVFAAPQWINFTWTFQTCFVVVFFAAIAAFVALKNSIGGVRSPERSVSALWVAASIAMGLIATGSMANGLLVWPLLVLMAVCVGLPRKVIAALAVVGFVATFAYLYGYRPRDPASISSSWMKVPEIVAFGFAYLGSALDEPIVAATGAVGLDWDSYRVPLCALAGLLGIMWFVDLVILTIREPSRQTPARIATLHIVAFLLASSALTAVGRVQFPVKDSLTSRYVTPSLLFWASLIALALSASTAERRSRGSAHSGRLRVVALIAAAFVGGLGQLPKVAYAVDAERYLSEGEYALINNVFAPEAWQRFVGSGTAGSMIPVVRYFRAHHLASFSREWTRWIGDPALAHFVMTSSDSDCIGAWESVSHVGGSFSPAALANGWGYDRRFERAPDRVVFVDGARRIVGFATPTRRRPDLLSGHPEVSTNRVGWQGYLPAGLSSDITAYLVLGDGRRLCRAGAAHVPGNYLTVAAEKAGGIIPGVEVSADRKWVKDLRPLGAATPPFTTETWSSQTLNLGTGVLRLGPVKATAGLGIGLPLATGPRASAVRLSVIERGTGEVLAAANPPAGASAWELWRLELPVGAPDMMVDYVVEQKDTGAGDWVTVGLPRFIRP